METPYIKSLREKYAQSIKKAIAKENARLNNLYREFSLGVFNEAQSNEALKEMLESNSKINKTFQKLLTAFNQSQETESQQKEKKK